MKEEKAKLECQHRLAQQDLLLRKDLDAAELSELYRKLSATSQVLVPNLSMLQLRDSTLHRPCLRTPGMDGWMQSPTELTNQSDGRSRQYRFRKLPSER